MPRSTNPLAYPAEYQALFQHLATSLASAPPGTPLLSIPCPSFSSARYLRAQLYAYIKACARRKERPDVTGTAELCALSIEGETPGTAPAPALSGDAARAPSLHHLTIWRKTDTQDVRLLRDALGILPSAQPGADSIPPAPPALVDNLMRLTELRARYLEEQ